ncbi:hypothetical protein SAMN05660706_11835 [Desulfoscipio geothermicus DSM 3669]|uniref:Uncharacterized protein n=1 Tax=Desulfoscipio geothermicus DSM 3669 TaxID=1121426 RepID=A0A1I6DV79_9FIRM|nr:hypothetical protein SAMN05660706_11835 [Desulfoscipio geothermicus DSM 3669]
MLNCLRILGFFLVNFTIMFIILFSVTRLIPMTSHHENMHEWT